MPSEKVTWKLYWLTSTRTSNCTTHRRDWRGDEQIGLYRGRDSLFTNLLGEMQSVFADFRIEADEFIDTGDTLFAAVKIEGAGIESGAHVEMRVYHVWTYENEIARRLEIFTEREQALEAAGAE